MPTYQTRVLTARDRELLDKLDADPRYRKLARQLRGSVSVPKPKGKAVQAPEEAPATDTPADPPKAATQAPTAPEDVPKPKSHHHFRSGR